MSQSTNIHKNEHSVAVELEPMLELPRSRRTTSPGRSRNAREIDLSNRDAETIPIPGASPAPRAKPEFEEDEDDIDDDKLPPQATNNPGVDDGFFTGIDNESGFDTDTNHLAPPSPNGLIPRRRPSLNPFPFSPGFDPNNIGGGTTAPDTPIPDINVYQHKKTLAQGMMDLALLSANANQLRYVLESYARHPYYYASITFISISIIFQVAVGIGLILNSRYNIKNEKDMCRANKINNFTVIGIFIVTTVNVFISAFGVANPPPDMNG